MLIIFGVVLMAIFGLGPVFDQMTQGFQSTGGLADDPVIIKYRDGDITRSKLDELQRNHYATRRFLGALVEQAAKQCEAKDVQYSPLAAMVQPLSRADNQDVIDEQMLVRKLLADRAEDEGVVVSDGMIDDYLSLMAGQAEFAPRDWKQINKLVNQRIPMTVIRKHLGLELKTMQMQQYASVGIPLNPIPTEAVELYARANNRIECEVVPVSVEEYVSKVTEQPGDAELRALYEEGKYEYADVGMQTPGFKVPRKVNVQYFVGEMGTFLDNEMAKLTDAQVAAEYEKLVAAEDPMVVEIVPQAEPEGFDLDLSDDEPAKEESSEAKTEPSDADANVDVKADVPVLSMPEAETTEPAVPDPEKLLKDVPAETKPADGLKVTPAEEGAGSGSDQSVLVRGTKSQFASFVQEEEPASEESSATETTAAETTTPGTTQEGGSDVGGIGDMQLSDETAGPSTGEATKKTQIKPLADVADDIRRRLAIATAFSKKNEAIKRAMISMQTYQNQVLRWETSRESEKTESSKPEMPDFDAIAKDNGLVFRESGMMLNSELAETDIGRVFIDVETITPQGPVRTGIQLSANKIFLDFDRVEVLIPQVLDDNLTRNSYVYWLAEKEDVRIPEFDEAKPEIIKYWKHQQAVELARKAAEQIAAKAKSEGKKLTELYPDTAAPTGEFTWFRPGRNATATYGMPFGIDNPGEEFMSTAFSLEENGTGVAANQARSKVYAIQRTTPAASVSELGQEYLEQQFFRFKRVPTDVMGAAQYYAQELEYDWRDEFVKSMELKRMK
ncbi:hypothetical protein [Mariniblastus fucicola]|nr:hypothetical protein [Mariniblastus fucicola]